MNDTAPVNEERRSSFRADVTSCSELAVVRRRGRKYTVWMRNVSSGGVGFSCDEKVRFRVGEKIVMVSGSGTFEGRVRHVTRQEGGKRLIGVERVKTLDALHEKISERDDLPRSSSWTASLAGWSAASAAICGAFFAFEIYGYLALFGVQTNLTTLAAQSPEPSRKWQDVVQRMMKIDALRDESAARRLGLSERQRLHAVAIADRAAASIGSLFVRQDRMSQEEWSEAAANTVDVAETHIEELLNAEQLAEWQTNFDPFRTP